MVNPPLIYRQKLSKILNEVGVHLSRLEEAIEELNKHYQFPLTEKQFKALVDERADLAYADQLIYRFSKAQDTIGAKLFKAFLQYQGENVDRPFLDILTALEKLNLVDVDEWFLLREIRNQIAHNYEDDLNQARQILNKIEQGSVTLKAIYKKII